MTQAFHVKYDDLFQLRQILTDFEDFIQLLFVLADVELGLAVSHNVFHLLRGIRSIDAHADAAGALGPQIAVQPLRIVFTDDGHPIAFLHAELMKGQGHILGFLAILVP